MNARREHPAPERWTLFTLDLLADDERLALEQHLASCDACRALVDDERAALEPAPGDAPGHVPADVIARWEDVVAEFGTVERGLYARHFESCAQCPAILRRLGHDPDLVRAARAMTSAPVTPIAHRRPSGLRVSRRMLAFAAGAAAVAVALLLGPQLFAPSREGPGGPTIARGPGSLPSTPLPAPVDSPAAPAAPVPGASTPPDVVSPDTTRSTPRLHDADTPSPSVAPSTAITPPTAIAGGVPVLVRPTVGGPAANPVLAGAVARAIDAVPGLEQAGGEADAMERYTVRATLGGVPSRASDASRPGAVQPRGTIRWELVDRYTGETVATRTATFDSAQAGVTVARMSRQVDEAIVRAPWAGRVRSADASRVVVESRDAGEVRPAVGAVLDLFARGRERVDAETQAVLGYEWIRVAGARVIAVEKDEIVATPLDVVKGSLSLKDATLARLQGPQ